MKNIKLRYIFFAIIALLIVAFVGFGKIMEAGLLSVYDVEKPYIYEPPGADITILEFSQYGCNVCRTVHPSLKKALEQDGRVRYIPRPVQNTDDIWLGTVVHAVYAAALQGKYIEMHNAIYENWPVESRKQLFSIATEFGLDVTQLERDMDSEEVKNHVQETKEYFRSWRLPKVPAFLIDKKILYLPDEQEMPTVEIWLEKFERVRE